MKSIIGIYDFELFPYALGDVLTWNVRTAMRCEELGRETVDIYICADKRFPSGIYQRSLVKPDNFELFFSELYSAFGTHPRLGNIHIFREREAMILRLQEHVAVDPVDAEALDDYLKVLGCCQTETIQNKVRRRFLGAVRKSSFIRRIFRRALPAAVKDAVLSVALPSEEAINNYFIKYIHSHESINQFAEKRGRIPLLGPALGCTPDIDELIATRLTGKTIVPFHLRLRRLDAGYGGEHSYARDSDFLEWYDFLREAGRRYPDIVFVALGRLQEKPLELLALPNVLSLRVFGMGLGHELTLMLKSSLFIGTSSGFAAFANFSATPYFITRMNPGSCHAYAIPEGAEQLPFALPRQKLVYAQETTDMLMDLLIRGLDLPVSGNTAVSGEPSMPRTPEIDIQAWLNNRSRPHNPATTTCRFYTNDHSRQEETAYLIFPALERARLAWTSGSVIDAKATLDKLERNFTHLCSKIPEYLLLWSVMALESDDALSIETCGKAIQALPAVVRSRRDMQLLSNCIEQRVQNRVSGIGAGSSYQNLRTLIMDQSFEMVPK